MDTTVALAKKLIELPSYVSKENNENEIGEFVFQYLKKFSYFKVSKQKVARNRWNIIAQTQGDPRVFIAGHLDTVIPNQTRNIGRVIASVKGRNLFGLGALDTKGGIAALLDTLRDFKNIRGLTLLFYCDEEYNFLGMKRFVGQWEKKIGNLAILIEPTDLKIWNAQRGLIEIYFSVRGKRGHAANLDSGYNAIEGTFAALYSLKKYLYRYKDSVLGASTLNVAYLQGGTFIERKGDTLVIDKQANIIPDFSEVIIDIRTISSKVNAKKIKLILQKSLKSGGMCLMDYRVRHQVNPLFTSSKVIQKVIEVLKKEVGVASYIDPSKKGLGDAYLIKEKYNIPVIYIGPCGKNSHGLNEYVDTPSLIKLKKVYSSIIKQYCETQIN